MNSDFFKKNKKILIGSAIALLAIYAIKNNFFKSNDPTGYYNPGSGNNPTPSTPQVNFDAPKVANKLYNAMREMGTDEEKILSALKTVNEQQFAQVIAAFGSKPYNTVLGNQQSFGFGLDSLTLPEWLEHELSANDYNTLAAKYPNYL